MNVHRSRVDPAELPLVGAPQGRVAGRREMLARKPLFSARLRINSGEKRSRVARNAPCMAFGVAIWCDWELEVVSTARSKFMRPRSAELSSCAKRLLRRTRELIGLLPSNSGRVFRRPFATSPVRAPRRGPPAPRPPAQQTAGPGDGLIRRTLEVLRRSPAALRNATISRSASASAGAGSAGSGAPARAGAGAPASAGGRVLRRGGAPRQMRVRSLPSFRQVGEAGWR